MYAVVVYSLLLNVLTPYFPPSGISNDVFLNALFEADCVTISPPDTIGGGVQLVNPHNPEDRIDLLKPEDVLQALKDSGVSFVGVKGFIGGFGRRMLGSFGESVTKTFVAEAVSVPVGVVTAFIGAPFLLATLALAWWVRRSRFGPV